MTPLPPDAQLRNRQLIAERLGWPDGALDACLALESDFPGWTVYWTAGGLLWTPEPGYRAFMAVGWNKREVYGATPEELRAALAGADEDVR